MSASLGLVALLGLSATGFHDHGTPRGACCEGCAGRPSALQAEVRTLRTSPRWKARDDAAEALRKFDWRRHPEAVFALRDALLADPKDDVREEAAESLKKMGACVPMVHEALSRAAATDPEDDVRDEARDALKAIGRRCVVECRVCGSSPAGAKAVPPDWVPILEPGRRVFPSTTTPAFDRGPALEPIPSATPPPALPDADIPPPPPTPYRPESPIGPRAGVGSRVR